MSHVSGEIVHMLVEVVQQIVAARALLVRQPFAGQLDAQHLAHHAQHAYAERVRLSTIYALFASVL